MHIYSLILEYPEIKAKVTQDSYEQKLEAYGITLEALGKTQSTIVDIAKSMAKVTTVKNVPSDIIISVLNQEIYEYTLSILMCFIDDNTVQF